MSNLNGTNSTETHPQASELHGRELSLVVALSVILFLLLFFFHLLWHHKKQQTRDTNITDGTTIRTRVNCPRVNETALELPSLPVFVQPSTDAEQLRDCAVCLTEISVGNGNSGRILPACGHVFHKECIDLWFRYRSICPVCRANIVRKPCADQKSETAA